MLPKRSISSAPKNPTSTTPRWTFIPMTSRKPLQHVARYQIRGSARPTAVSIGLMFMTPISKSALSPGACVRLASTHATCGNPRPTTTTSPSRSSRAPAVAIISLARTSGMVALQRLESRESYQSGWITSSAIREGQPRMTRINPCNRRHPWLELRHEIPHDSHLNYRLRHWCCRCTNRRPESNRADSRNRGLLSIRRGRQEHAGRRSCEDRLHGRRVHHHGLRECVRLGRRRHSEYQNAERSLWNADPGEASCGCRQIQRDRDLRAHVHRPPVRLAHDVGLHA